MEEYLKNYLSGNANDIDIFEFIKKAITVAATDLSTEFRNNKDKIIDTLYSCNKNTHVDDPQKESIPKASKTACDQPKAKRLSVFVYRQGVAEVLRIKGILEGEYESVVIICDLLDKLRYMGLSVNTLEVTGIGKTVRVLRKHASKEVSQVACRLLKEWIDMVEEWLKDNNDASCVVHPTSDEENKAAKGQFITGNQESKDMRSKEVLSIQDKTKKVEPPMEKENQTITQRPNNQTVDVVVKKVSLPAVSKPVVTNLVAKTQSGITSQSLKSTKSLMIPHHQNKPTDASMSNRIEKFSEEKLKAVKRKLHQAYEDAENMKKKRRTQMLAFHELPKKGLPLKQTQNVKPRYHHLRRRRNNAIRSMVRAY